MQMLTLKKLIHLIYIKLDRDSHTSAFHFTKSWYNKFKYELLEILYCHADDILSHLGRSSFQFLPTGWNRGHTTTTHILTHGISMTYRAHVEGCETRNQVRFHESTLSVSCLDLTRVSNPRNLYPAVSRHVVHSEHNVSCSTDCKNGWKVICLHHLTA